MAGVHVVQRTTNLLNRNIVKATSVLTLPSSATYRANTTPGVHGAFPEFIHGFFTGKYGFDAGLMYKDGEFKLFYYGTDDTAVTTWDERSVPANSAALGKTVTFSTHFTSTKYVMISTSIGSYAASLLVQLTDDAYEAMTNGCMFVREMVIAVNPESNGSILVPTGASFTTATFKNTDLITASGASKALTTSISSVVEGTFDTGTPTGTYSGDGSSTTVSGYVHDTGYGYI